MGDAWPDRRDAVRAALLDYLGRHPQAADSLAGVCAWWLDAQGVRETEELVEDVLDQLVAEGVLACVALRDGTSVYRAPRGCGDASATGSAEGQG